MKNYQEAGRVLNHCHTVLDSYTGPQSTILHTFYLVIQVTHLLSAAQVRQNVLEGELYVIPVAIR